MNTSFLWIVRRVIAMSLALAGAYWIIVGPLAADYMLNRMVATGCFAMAVIGLAVVVGASQQFHLGQGFFMAMGAYVSTYFSDARGWGPIAGLVIGVVVTVIVAWILGLILSRLDGLYFAVATLALPIIGGTIIDRLPQFTGGEQGQVVNYFTLGSWSLDSYLRAYVFVWAGVMILVVLAHRYLTSRRGYILRAVGSDEAAARSLGIKSTRAKAEAFAISAGFAAIGGSFRGYTNGFLYPGYFDVGASLEMIVYAVAGFGTVVGGVVATAVMGLIPVVFESLANSMLIVLGTILSLLLIFLPESVDFSRFRIGRKRRESRLDSAEGANV